MKNNPVNRIKLMMSYEMGKTLEENLKSSPVINEEETINQNETVDEESDLNELGGEAGLAKDLLGTAKMEEKLAHLAQFFKVGEDVAKSAFSKDLTTLGKDLDKAIAADIKAGFKGGGQALGRNSKAVAKQIAMKEILSSNKALSEQDIIQIIDRVKNQTKLKAAAKEGKSAASVAAKATNAGVKDTKAVESEVKATATNASQQEAAFVLGTAAKNPENKEIAGILGRSKEVVKGMSEKAFDKFKRVSKYLAAKYLIMLGLAGGGAYLLAKSVFGGNTNPQDPKNNLFPKCLNDLLDDEGTTVGYDAAGAPVVIVKTTGNEEYDKLGGLKFFLNNRVVSGDGSKKGTWSCKAGEVTVQEEVDLNEAGNEISLSQMSSYVDDAVDDLDGFVAVYNLKSLKNILTGLSGKTYKGKNAVQAFMDFYKQDEGGDDFIADVNSVGVKTLGVEGMELKDEVLKLAGNVTNTGDGNTKTGIGGIDIKWDGSSATPPAPPAPPAPPKKEGTKYQDCSGKDFPYAFGCISPKIAEIQGCLQIQPQKGYFGPKTKKALIDLQYDLSNGITSDIYDSVKSNCGEQESGQRKPLANIEPLSGRKLSDIKAPTSISLKDLENKIKPIEKTPAEVYQSIKDAGLIVGEDGNNRIKYKGPTPGDDILGKLDSALSDMGYDRIKQLEDMKRYGSKYVWLKR